MLRYHVIFVTKYRYKVLVDNIKTELYRNIADTAKKMNCSIIEINGEEDHVHFIIETLPNSGNVSVIVNVLKSVTSRLLRKQHPNLLATYYGDNSKLWSRSYFVATVGDVNLETLKKYIKNQDRGDSSPTCRG